MNPQENHSRFLLVVLCLHACSGTFSLRLNGNAWKAGGDLMTHNCSSAANLSLPARDACCRLSLAETAASCVAEKRDFSITDFVQGPGYKNPRARFDIDAYHALNRTYPGLRPLDVEHNVYLVEEFIPLVARRTFLRYVRETCEFLPSVEEYGNKSDASLLQRPREGCNESMWRSRVCRSETIRTSMSCESDSLRFDYYEHVAHYVRSRIKLLLPRLALKTCFEEVQVTRYQPGDYYTRHLDGRRVTVIVFVGESGLDSESPTVGGHTYFPKLGLRVEPHPGRALIFFPNYENGDHKVEMLHAAEEVKSGRKYIIQQWMNSAGRRGCTEESFGQEVAWS